MGITKEDVIRALGTATRDSEESALSSPAAKPGGTSSAGTKATRFASKTAASTPATAVDAATAMPTTVPAAAVPAISAAAMPAASMAASAVPDCRYLAYRCPARCTVGRDSRHWYLRYYSCSSTDDDACCPAGCHACRRTYCCLACRTRH
ncbi:transcriptional regulatory protein AlgP-like [Drosophila willistoni]|uniref:transcriptional regulatory protein AlgP-like n=1 Tax=Drosophila willistoni TaxID=7260 RepID=UPI000C26CEA6|nr:transcriptional regulatory protein AlgP-like [Drosophila willistoni]